MSAKLHNWAANLEYATSSVCRPSTIDELQEVVSRSQKARALGTRHSFNRIADTTGDLISTENLNRILSLDVDRNTVTVEGGVRYGELGQFLHRKGYAIQNLASLPHISVAGACATATHGSGVGNGNLATAVSGMDIVTATGDMISLSRESDGDTFSGAVVSLGAFGVAARMTLNLKPTFEVSQRVFEKLPFAALEHNFDEIMSSGYSVSLFTFWTSDTIDQVWVKSAGPATSTPESFGAVPATSARSPLPDGDVENCTEQLGVKGPWYDRLPHFRMGFTPSSGEELQTEYFVARKDAWPALCKINDMRDAIAPLLYTTEIRCIAADDLWMSPNYRQDSVAIHFTWKQDWERVRALLTVIEAQLEPFEARPHWAKLFTMQPSRIAPLYSKIQDFRKLVRTFDPDGKFRNDFMEQYLFNQG